jgi:hypothetical protein
MKEIPILFAAAMVRALLALLKKMTRREVNKLVGFGKITEFGKSDTCGYDWHFRDKLGCWNDLTHEKLLAACPYGRVGDRLWVRETISHYTHVEGVWYWADGNIAAHDCDRPITPSIHMPRWASRLLLEVLEVRVEQLQNISEEDAIAEGIEHNPQLDPLGPCKYRHYGKPNTGTFPATNSFRTLWESINGKGSWDANPWVWVITFKVIKARAAWQAEE